MDNRQQQIMQGTIAAKNFRDLFSVILQSGQGREIFEYYEGDQLVKISYEEFYRKVKGSAQKIRDQINPAESYIALKLPNGPEFCIMFWAILASGHNVILLNYGDDLDTTINLMAQAGTETLISEKLKEDIAYLPASSLIEEAGEFADNAWGDQVVLCTSGTTGDSRLFSHDSASICQMAGCLPKLAEDTDRWTRADVVEKCIAFLPFHHVFGLMAVFLFTLLRGNTLVFIPSLAPEVVLDSCKKHQITQVICIPLFWNALVKGLYRRIRQTEGESTLKAFEKLIDSNLQAKAAGKKLPFFLANKLKSIRKQLLGDDIYLCVSGGGYIPPRTLEVLNGLGYYFVNGYGLTEAGVISVCNDEDVTVRLNGNVGKPFEPEGTMISPDGEILLRGGCLHTGVLKGGEYLPRDYTGDNWFETGDTGRIEDGAIFIDGRLKEVIISPSGENIYPDTVEAIFQDLPGVQQLNVVGVSDGVNEYANLVLELAPDVDMAELDQLLKAKLIKLPPSSAISNVLVSLKPLPISTTRKVKRQLLAKELNEGTWPAMKLSKYIEAEAEGTAPELEMKTTERSSQSPAPEQVKP
ncbi:MAG TPA: acyl--CoA ligase, partial [Clostridiaceae bacterium]|nr:acyl--CoA ligase [Clostridiaceae bacterium]